MQQIPVHLASFSDYASFVRHLLHWPPQATSDAGELILVGATLAVSMSIMVAFGQWWSR